MDLLLNVKIKKKYLGLISTEDCQNRYFDEEIAKNEEISKEKKWKGKESREHWRNWKPQKAEVQE